MEELRILSPTAILGYGFPERSFVEGMGRKPDLLAVDAGSTDPGPYYLGAGVSFTEYRAVKRDLTIMLQAALEAGIPVFIGSAGGSGGRPHLEWNLRIIREIAHEKRLHFRLAAIEAEIPRETVTSLWQQHRLKPLPPAPDLSSADIEETERIVGQMGVEPFLRAMESGAQVILAGRSYDPAVFAAYGIARGFDPGLAIHLGKILECAAIAATPGSGSDCLMGYLHRSDFEVEPLNPARRCTPLSVAAHTLYEKSNPYELPGPGGVLDLHAARFDAVTENRVRVTGSRFLPTSYQVKLEGVKRTGYRTVSIAATRDPLMIREIDQVVSGVRERVTDNFKAEGFDYFLDFKIYGRNGVMGSLEPEPVIGSHELGIVIEAVAASQELADTVCGFARSTMLHFGYPGRIATAGNLAFPYSPSDFPAGPVYVFSIYHLAAVTAEELFPVTVREIDPDGRADIVEEAIR
ncbi:MAG TPA: acyclic terpene utilization AtuA family protein [Bacillota bacterium]